MEQNNKEYKPATSWTYFMLNTTDCYVKLCENKTKDGKPYNTFYFYKQNKNGKELLKFSTFASNCFICWECKERYIILKLNPENPTDIKLISYLNDVVPTTLVVPFSPNYYWCKTQDDLND